MCKSNTGAAASELEIISYTIPVEKFQNVPVPERAFLVQLGWLCNDLMFYQKLLIGLTNQESSEQIQKDANAAQTLCCLRALSGRLYEAWEMLRTSYFSGISNNYQPKLDSIGRNALDGIKAVFSAKSCPIREMRNLFAFHTCNRAISNALASIDDSVRLNLYLAEKNGNSLYWFAEEVVGNGMLKLFPGDSKQCQMEKFQDDCFNLVALFTDFAQSAISVFLETYLEEDIQEKANFRQRICVEESLSQFSIPFFLRIDE
jgi:hypothetical protein